VHQIVRFVNRKHCDNLHRNKKFLKEKSDKLNDIGIKNKILINSDLCPYNNFLWGKCKKLFDEKPLLKFWIYNGNLYIVADENSDRIKIDHLKSLQDIFPGYNFNSHF